MSKADSYALSSTASTNTIDFMKNLFEKEHQKDVEFLRSVYSEKRRNKERNFSYFSPDRLEGSLVYDFLVYRDRPSSYSRYKKCSEILRERCNNTKF